MPHALWPRSAAVRVPVPAAGHCWPVPPQETLKCSKAGLAQSLWGLWVLVCTVQFEPSERLWRVWGLILNMIFPSYHLVGASPLPLDVRYLFLVGSNILQPTVVQQGVAVLEFSQKMNICPSNPPSWIDPWSIGPRYDQWSLNTVSNFILNHSHHHKKKKKKILLNLFPLTGHKFILYLAYAPPSYSLCFPLAELLSVWEEPYTSLATSQPMDCSSGVVVCCGSVCSIMSNSCDPMDCSLPRSSVHGISQARILELVAISYSRGHSQLRNQTHVSRKSIALQADSLPPSHCIQVSHAQGLGHTVERMLCSRGLRADCLYPQGKVF